MSMLLDLGEKGRPQRHPGEGNSRQQGHHAKARRWSARLVSQEVRDEREESSAEAQWARRMGGGVGRTRSHRLSPLRPGSRPQRGVPCSPDSCVEKEA